MRLHCCLLFISLAVANANTPTPEDQSPEIQRAVASANQIVNATFSGDIDKVLSLTRPEAIKSLGGKDKAVTTIKQGLQDLKASKIKFSDCTIEAPGLVCRQKNQIFTILPYHFLIKTPKDKAIGFSYLLGVSDDLGVTWFFIDGAGLDATKLKTMFPDLPKEVVLPAVPPPRSVE